eukprot:gene19840-23764_t
MGSNTSRPTSVIAKKADKIHDSTKRTTTTRIPCNQVHLPDYVLRFIIDRLDMDHAVRASLVCTYWFLFIVPKSARLITVQRDGCRFLATHPKMMRRLVINASLMDPETISFTQFALDKLTIIYPVHRANAFLPASADLVISHDWNLQALTLINLAAREDLMMLVSITTLRKLRVYPTRHRSPFDLAFILRNNHYLTHFSCKSAEGQVDQMTQIPSNIESFSLVGHMSNLSLERISFSGGNGVLRRLHLGNTSPHSGYSDLYSIRRQKMLQELVSITDLSLSRILSPILIDSPVLGHLVNLTSLSIDRFDDNLNDLLTHEPVGCIELLYADISRLVNLCTLKLKNINLKSEQLYQALSGLTMLTRLSLSTPSTDALTTFFSHFADNRLYWITHLSIFSSDRVHLHPICNLIERNKTLSTLSLGSSTFGLNESLLNSLGHNQTLSTIKGITLVDESIVNKRPSTLQILDTNQIKAKSSYKFTSQA